MCDRCGISATAAELTLTQSVHVYWFIYSHEDVSQMQEPGAPAGFFAGGCNLWLIAPTFLLQCMHIKEKNWCSPNPSVENNLASSLFNCNKIVNTILSEL